MIRNMRLIPIRSHYTPLKLVAALIGGAIGPLFVRALVPLDPQSGIAVVFWSLLVPAIPAFALGWVEQRTAIQLAIAGCSSFGTSLALSSMSRNALPCFATSALIGFVPALIGIAISGSFSSLSYTFVIRRGSDCPHCGYSLIGLKSDRCPECGVAIDYLSLGLTPEALADRARSNDDAKSR